MRPSKLLIRALAAAAAMAVAVPIGMVAAQGPAGAVGPDRLPMTVTNSTGRGEAVHLYVLGTNLATGRLGYVNAAGTFNNWPAGSPQPSPAPDVSIPGPGNGGSTTLQIPRGLSGRVYMSFGEKLRLFLTPDGLVQPAPWNSSDPNNGILFDWSEFTYNDAGLWINSSQVDMFSVPHAVTVTGASGTTRRTGDVVDDGRNRVINAIRNQPGWDRTVVTRGDGTVLRVLAPGKAADAGRFDPNYLQPYIDSAWGAYASKTLTVAPFEGQSVRYFGRTSGSVMNFTNGSGQQVASFRKPTTSDVWGCDGALLAPNDAVVGPIARTLCAAMHRTTLGRLDTQPSGGAADFYQGAITNHYSRIIHQNMSDGRAYGFAFDDVQAQESLVYDGDPRRAGIVLSPFGPGGGGGGNGGDGGGGGGTAAVVGSQLRGPGGKCVDIPGGDSGGDGAAVQLWDCEGGARDQHWTGVGSTLRTLGRCLDVAGGGTGNGTPVQLANCNSSGAQQWVQQANGSMRNPQSGRCLDSPSGSTANGTRLQIWDCNGSPAQVFRNGSTITGPAGKCVDVAGDDNGANSSAVQLWDCQGAAVDQRWALVDGSLRTLGRCLDIAGGATAGGTQIQLWDCNGSGAQQWVQQSNGSLRNPQSGRCLDSPSGSSANGTRLQIWDCNGSPAQVFRLS